MTQEGVIDWLLDSDPALRWQVERDLLGAPDEVWQGTRARVPTEGFGRQLLARQDPDGQWAGGAYFPADATPEEYENRGQPWTATTWSLLTLREWGVDADVLGDTAEKLAVNSHWEYEGLPYWGGEVDACINGYTFANGAWLGADVSAIGDWFLEHEAAEGGWNCEWVEGSTRASFHSTLNSVRGILEHERYTGGSEDLRAARHRGEEYLLRRHLLRRLSDGEIVGPWATHFGFPFRWTYSALNAADYFRSASPLDGSPPDPRLSEAVEFIRTARRGDGRWVQERVPRGRVWFDVDVPDGEPSKWLTMISLRVLKWWDER
ncbi:squalene cyclase [Tessaracoccus sp. OS52]|uniref:squalene cyclase n=1 Tax=Tessaracoccus sp. OS52 TaxID=2886691 RepID=UPI001D0FA69D|nr:squalene cyclase [Tessaracoccus sp. OS52]MCC2592590.1 squalene cyclase [Tessaracoccus sp. OS52]